MSKPLIMQRIEKRSWNMQRHSYRSTLGQPCKHTLHTWLTQLKQMYQRTRIENTNAWLCWGVVIHVNVCDQTPHKTSATHFPHHNAAYQQRQTTWTIFLVQKSIRSLPAWDSRIYNVTVWVMTKSSHPTPPVPWSSRVNTHCLPSCPNPYPFFPPVAL